VNILIYGGHSPLGLASAQLLSARGCHVSVVTRNIDESLLDWSKLSDVELVQLNLTDAVDSEDLADFYMVNGKVADSLAFFHKYRGDAADVIEAFRVEVLAPQLILQNWALSPCKFRRRALLLSSPASRAVVSDQPFTYHATKSGVNAIVRWGAAKFGPSGISVNGLTPGSAVFKERAADFYSKNPEIVSLYEEITPSKKMVTVQEIADVASFLLTSSPHSLNGQIIEVDGGVSILDVVGVGKSLRSL